MWCINLSQKSNNANNTIKFCFQQGCVCSQIRVGNGNFMFIQGRRNTEEVAQSFWHWQLDVSDKLLSNLQQSCPWKSTFVPRTLCLITMLSTQGINVIWWSLCPGSWVQMKAWACISNVKVARLTGGASTLTAGHQDCEGWALQSFARCSPTTLCYGDWFPPYRQCFEEANNI